MSSMRRRFESYLSAVGRDRLPLPKVAPKDPRKERTAKPRVRNVPQVARPQPIYPVTTTPPQKESPAVEPASPSPSEQDHLDHPRSHQGFVVQ